MPFVSDFVSTVMVLLMETTILFGSMQTRTKGLANHCADCNPPPSWQHDLGTQTTTIQISKMGTSNMSTNGKEPYPNRQYRE
ncbi:hypothetical protein PF011_g8534 [Phytophthora fragariae]|uniref:Secreted protein n=1 Tax=Phytophthora fragariae TaxID=53985 RepID=A0A6A3L330_9STRA|nr:hypothetical protein PF011_g8534 [Phytophthora fragariae]